MPFGSFLSLVKKTSFWNDKIIPEYVDEISPEDFYELERQVV
jgi:hypothetical protein